MKYSLCLCLSFFFFSVFAQSSNPKLDNHRNFKEIHLGDSPDKWGDILTYRTSVGDVDQYWFDTGYCCDRLFSYPVELINVLVKNNKIVRIHIDLHKIQETNTDLSVGWGVFENIEAKFNTMFGQFHGIGPMEPNSYDRLTRWQGSETILDLNYMYYGVVNGDRASVTITDLSYFMSTLDGGF